MKRNSYSKAYQLAREAISFKGRRILQKMIFLKKNFCESCLDSFRKKLVSGLDVRNFPQHYDGMRQVGDAIHAAMEKGSFLLREKTAVLPEIYLINQEAKALKRRIWQKNPVASFNFWSD